MLIVVSVGHSLKFVCVVAHEQFLNLLSLRSDVKVVINLDIYSDFSYYLFDLSDLDKVFLFVVIFTSVSPKY